MSHAKRVAAAHKTAAAVELDLPRAERTAQECCGDITRALAELAVVTESLQRLSPCGRILGPMARLKDILSHAQRCADQLHAALAEAIP